jgi:hypothetical protein
MCDINTLNQKNITFEEPQALFWTKPGCQGNQMSLPPGDYPNMYNLAIKANDIDGLWLPPNMKLHAFGNPDYSHSFGVYDPGLQADLNNPLLLAPRNDIDSFHLIRTKPWKQHLADCCTGKTSVGASPLTCGMFWGKGEMGNRGVCDDFMENHCKQPENKDSDQCTCYSVPIDDADDINVRLLKANPKCWSQKCQTSGYMPSNIVSTPCPNVKVCRQEIVLPGSNNIITNSDYIQDCNDTYNTQNNFTKPTNTPTSVSNNSSITTETNNGTYDNNPEPAKSISTSYIILYVFLAFISFIILIAGGYFIYNNVSKSDNTTN